MQRKYPDFLPYLTSLFKNQAGVFFEYDRTKSTVESWKTFNLFGKLRGVNEKMKNAYFIKSCLKNGNDIKNIRHSMSLLRNKMKRNQLNGYFFQGFVAWNKCHRIAAAAEADLLDVLIGEKKYTAKLRQRLISNPSQSIKSIFAQILLIGQALHRLNLVYRDFKPDNMVLSFTQEGEVRLHLIDIDDVCSIKEPFSTISGTHWYASPELLDYAQTLWFASSIPCQKKKGFDCYAIGVTFSSVLDSLMPVGAGETPEFELFYDLVDKLTNIDPDERWTLAQAMKHSCFGSDSAQYFHRLEKRLSQDERYYDGFYQRYDERFPEEGDSFFAESCQYKALRISLTRLSSHLSFLENAQQDQFNKTIEEDELQLCRTIALQEAKQLRWLTQSILSQCGKSQRNKLKQLASDTDQTISQLLITHTSDYSITIRPDCRK